MVIRYFYNLLIDMATNIERTVITSYRSTFLSDLHSFIYCFSIMSTILSAIIWAIKVLKVWIIELIKIPPNTTTRCIALRI